MKTIELAVDKRGIAELIFDLPDHKVNILSVSVLEELLTHLKTLQDNPKVRLLVIKSGKKNGFVAGADLNAFPRLFRDKEAAKKMIDAGHKTFDCLAALPFPTVAAIHGVCLGGGLELALACQYRVISDHPSTTLGLPEVTLGIFPGWGGTARLPRLVGLQSALQMILSGKPINAKKAKKIGLANAVFAHAFFDEGVAEFIKKCLKEKVSPKSRKNWLLEGNSIGRQLLFFLAKRQIQGPYLAPRAALRLVRKSCGLPLTKGLEMEKDAFIAAIPRDFRQAPHLVHLFFANELLKKEPGVEMAEAAKRTFEQLGVIGSGTMGAGIAWFFSYRGHPVRFKDLNWEAVGRGYAHAWDIYQTLKKKNRLTAAEAMLSFHRLSGTTSQSGFGNCDLVIEAASEEFGVKRQIFAELEKKMRKDAILATNTSSLTVTALSEGLEHPERLVGMHFFNPPARMPLVEVVAGEKTDRQVLAAAVAFCQKIKKKPLVVKDCPGFLVNRIYALAMNEALWLLEEGTPMEKIGRTVTAFGMPMDPFTLADFVGNDINYHVLSHFEKAYGVRMAPPELLSRLFEKGLFGKKIQRGFYLYKGEKSSVNPEALSLIPEGGEEASQEQILERFLLAMVAEAARCLEERVVASASHLDLALVLGTGFPPYRGGLLRWADSVGSRFLFDKLTALCSQYGERFAPCDLLQEMARKRRSFYSEGE